MTPASSARTAKGSVCAAMTRPTLLAESDTESTANGSATKVMRSPTIDVAVPAK